MSVHRGRVKGQTDTKVSPEQTARHVRELQAAGLLRVLPKSLGKPAN